MGGWKGDCFFQTMLKNKPCVFVGTLHCAKLTALKKMISTCPFSWHMVRRLPDTLIEWPGFSAWRQ